MKTATNKRLLIFKSCGDSNQCTSSRGKPDTHDTYASRTSPRTLSVSSTRTWQPFANHQQRWEDRTPPEKKGSWHNPQHASWSIRKSATQFLSQDNHWSSNESQASIGNRLHRFIGPITSVCDWYIQYLLLGANPLVLNRHRQGLQPWRCCLSTYHSLNFPTDGLYFPPKGPVRSQVIQSQHKPLAKLRVDHLAVEWPSCHPDLYRTYNYG
jgi:hypothetical protein